MTTPGTAARLIEDPPRPATLALLRRHGLAEPERSAAELRLIAANPLARGPLLDQLPTLLPALAEVPEPDAALGRLERLVRAGGAGPLASLRGRGPRAARNLLWALGGAPFLAEQLIRQPQWAESLTDPRRLERAHGARRILREVRAAIASAGPAQAGDVLRRSRRYETVRVALRDLLRMTPVPGTLASLSAIADALIPAALDLCLDEVGAGGGPPARTKIRRSVPAGFVVLALGKLGGSELNFSSDVDLVFVHAGAADDGSRRRAGLDRDTWAEAVARRLTATLGEASHEGHVYRVDLRLRPEGRAGAITHSLDGADEYYRRRGATWERLALLKARPVAGDLRLGRELLRRVVPFVWQRPFEGEAVRQVLRLKQESDRRLAARGLTERHVKLGRGGIREIELITQVLQIRRGGARLRAPRARSTLAAIETLHSLGALPRPETEVLARAYLFLRDVENKLQMAHDAQTHVLPAEEGDLGLLARRLGYGREPRLGQEPVGDLLRSDLRGHTDAVHALFGEILGRLVG